MTPAEALAFLRAHGVILEAGTDPMPSLTEAVVGGPIRGSWWAHPEGRQIFTRAVRESPDVLVYRLVGGKITYVHRRLWPALVRVAHRFPTADLGQIREMHTHSGKHVTKKTPFPVWVSEAAAAQALKLTEQRAARLLGDWSETVQPAASRRAAKKKAIVASCR